MGTEIRDRDPEELGKDIVRFPPSRQGAYLLERHIVKNWTINEILKFNLFLQYMGWRYYVSWLAKTEDGRDKLRYWAITFSILVARANIGIGSKMQAEKSATPPPHLSDLAENVFHMTIDELEHSIPNDDGRGKVLAQILAGVNHGNAVAERTHAATERNAAALQAQGADVKRGADAAERSEALVRAHVVPRPGDYEVTLQQMSDILARLNVRRGEKTIRRWEKYLSTGGREGTKPPEGYTLQTRLTLESATAWAKHYAAQEKSKLNVKVSLEGLTGGRQ